MISSNQFQRPDDDKEPTVSVLVKFQFKNSIIKKEFEVSKDEINEISWTKGTTNDPYYDDLKNNEDRFIYRVNDVLHHLINAEPELDNWLKWDIQYFGDYDIGDFINDQ